MYYMILTHQFQLSVERTYLPYTKKHCKTNNQTVFSAFFHVLTIEFPSDTYISET